MSNKTPFSEFEFKWPHLEQNFWEKFKVPGVDAASMMESQKKNFDAVVKANQRAAEGYQNLMRRQTEILTETMQSIQESATKLMQANSGQDLPKTQMELMEKTIGRAFEHMKELADLTISANADAFNIIQDRTKESIKEMQSLAEQLSNKGKSGT